MAYPRSPKDKEGGLMYFPRMLDKIRLFEKGELPEDYHGARGRGFDGMCLNFLRVAYDDVVAQVKSGKSDAEVLAWCYQHGREANEQDIAMFNGYLSKRGLHDEASERIASVKEKNGIAHRDDIATFVDFIEFDEKRM